ncbi:uncharacterized protein LOC109844293 isoform X2 [Asparagus officinalis]|nr:uncharacterized protein LOC109844293 isoform X2 [Asparagus officinalis]
MAPAMGNPSRPNGSSLIRPSSRHKRSGYEPSDTETEWQESPWHDGLLVSNRSKTPNPARIDNPISNRSQTPDPTRATAPSNRSQRPTSKEDKDNSANRTSRRSPSDRRRSKSPYKSITQGEDAAAYIGHPGLRRNTSPFKVSEHRNPSPFKGSLNCDTSPFKASEHGSKHISPYMSRREELYHKNDDLDGSSRKKDHRTPSRRQRSEDKGTHTQPQVGPNMKESSRKKFQELSRASERSNLHQSRSMSVPKLRTKEREGQVNSGAERRPSPLAKTIIHEENGGSYGNYTDEDINVKIANMKLSKPPSAGDILNQDTESVSLGDIFVSRDCTNLHKGSANKGNKSAQRYSTFPESKNVVHQFNRGRGSFNQNRQVVSMSTVLSQANTSSSSAFDRTFGSKLSESSGKLSGSLKKITAIRQRSQADTWLSCVRRGGSCAKSKSLDSREVDEASFIERALVVEELRPSWAVKHRPLSLSKFICHKQQAKYLKELISHDNFPHILFKGLSGSGKKSLITALLHEIFGDSLKTSDDLRHFQVQETTPMQISVPVTSSPHHVELNLKSESKNARYALMALVKEITSDHALAPEVSDVSLKADYKVVILHEVDKVADSVQHLIKWIMDRYTEACKIILCCEDDASILNSVKTRCKFISVDPPVTNEIMEVLIDIAKKENLELSTSFAARIASKSKHNLRRAIMALEACRAHNYPFNDSQPIPVGWEEVVVEVAEEILADPSTKSLFFIRGKFQKLLVEFVHPKLILQKLVEQFLKRVEASIKRELYYWHAYYEKRLPVGIGALLKLEEFVAKFMSIYRKSSSAPQFV